jgi:hypothetical protein
MDEDFVAEEGAKRLSGGDGERFLLELSLHRPRPDERWEMTD